MPKRRLEPTMNIVEEYEKLRRKMERTNRIFDFILIYIFSPLVATVLVLSIIVIFKEWIMK